MLPIAAGEEIWCRGPGPAPATTDDAGRDLDAIPIPPGDAGTCTAGRPGPGAAHCAQWCFGTFRTDPHADSERGLTCFLIALDAPGVTVRPLRQIDGSPGVAEILFDDVEVPESQVLGEERSGLVGRPVDGRRASGASACAARCAPRKRRPASSTCSSSAGRPHRPPTPWPGRTSMRRPTGSTRTGRPPRWPGARRVGPRPAVTRSSGSESDVAIARDRPGALGVRRRTARGRVSGRVARRLPRRAGRTDRYRDERDAAQRRGRTIARPPGTLMVEFSFGDDQLELREAVRHVTRPHISDRRAACARRGFACTTIDHGGRVGGRHWRRSAHRACSSPDATTDSV